MAYEQKPGDIVIFKNTPKPGQTLHPNAPQYAGKGLDLNGNPIRISLWLKDGNSGKFFAGKLEAPYEGTGGQRSAGQGSQVPPVETEDIPF